MSNHNKPKPPSAEQMNEIKNRYRIREDGLLVAAKDYGGGHGNKVREGQPAGTPSGRGYLRIKLGGRKFLNHHVTWFLAHGAWPSQPLDHINGIKTDNRPENLREVTQAENLRAASATRTDNTSGYRGVSFHKASGKFWAKIRLEGKTHYLGLFTNKHAAALAYNLAAEPLGFAEEAIGQNRIPADKTEEAIAGVYERAAYIADNPNRTKDPVVRAIFLSFLPMMQAGTAYSLKSQAAWADRKEPPQ